MSNSLLRALYRVTPALGGEIKLLGSIVEKYGPIEPMFFGAISNPIGIEVEMEKVSANSKAFAALSSLWRAEADGSLRDAGVEFISKPLSGHLIDYALQELANIFTLSPVKQWSIRTSIHVHSNVSTMREQDLLGLTALYACFEDLFFSRVEPERKGNPYCYPLTNLSPGDVFVTSNMKYCAFNLAPVETQLTVEFRHMHGTDDLRTIKRWLQIICKLHRYVLKNGGDKIIDLVYSMPSRKEYADLVKEVFGATSILWQYQPIDHLISKKVPWAIAYLEKN